MRSRAVSALQNAIACTKLTLSTGNVSPLKKLELLPITDSNSRCVTSWVTIQKPRVRATSWLVQVTRVNWPGLSACIGIEGLNTTGVGTAGAGGPGRNRTPSKARHTEPTGCYGTGHS